MLAGAGAGAGLELNQGWASAVAKAGLCEPISIGSQFWALGANSRFGKPILGIGTIWGFGSQFWALGGDLGFGLRGPGKAPEV